MRERGWIGLVGLLIALVIVAVLAQTVLKSYGLIGADRTAASGPRVPSAAAPADDGAPPAPSRDPRERARGLEQQIQRDAQDLSRRIDEQTK
jgi:cytochrome c-type biogenesis protein CcmH/NrfG